MLQEMLNKVQNLGKSKFKIEVWFNGGCSSAIYKLREKDFYNIIENMPLDNETLFKAYIGDSLYCKHKRA